MTSFRPRSNVIKFVLLAILLGILISSAHGRATLASSGSGAVHALSPRAGWNAVAITMTVLSCILGLVSLAVIAYCVYLGMCGIVWEAFKCW